MLNFINALPGAVVQGLIWSIMALGIYITFKILDIADLTVDSSFCTGGAVCIVMMNMGYSVPLSMLLALLAGMAAGFLTGILHSYMGIPMILSGILTQLILWSINLVNIMGGAANLALKNSRKVFRLVNLAKNDFSLLVLLGLTAAVIGVLYYFFGTEIGCAIRATGSNDKMSRAQGINTHFTRILGLAISNGLVALSGSLWAQYRGAIDISDGKGAIVIGLAAVIIGQTFFSKISRNFAVQLFSVLLGSIIYFIIYTAAVNWGLNMGYLKMLAAVIMVVMLSFPVISKKFHFKKKVKGDTTNA